ncbi:MAG: hypothetical protein Q4D51_02615 [Eubacteriales bacterium]|nr:hypothetical protein [Eubacteriales bacterium]
MKKYEKPMVVENDVLAESIYMASGSNGSGKCYAVTYRMHQDQQTGRTNFRIQLDAKHSTNHNSNEQHFVLCFNKPVVFKSAAGGTLISGDGTTKIEVSYNYFNNPSDNIGTGEITVEADEGLAVTSAYCSFCDGDK